MTQHDDADLLDAISYMPRDQMEQMYREAGLIQARLQASGPSTDDELHAWINKELKLNIPRVSVCPDHCSPFEFVADLYFQRTRNAIAMANRGGSKTHCVSLVIYLMGQFRPNVECFQFGAHEEQALRAYNHLRDFILSRDHSNVVDMLRETTKWINRTWVKVATGTKKSVNSMHSQFVHADEVDLLDDRDIFYESRNIKQSKEVDGVLIPAIDVVTSTRKSAYGLMQELLDQIEEAKQKGRIPPYDLYTWCIYESAKNMPNCQIAKPELKDTCDSCDCHEIYSGKWHNGKDRTLTDVCQGRFAKSGGWIEHDDVIDLFRKNTTSMWEAQQECAKPSTEGLVVPVFDRNRHGIRNYNPDPENGPIYEGIDFGTTNPAAVEFVQYLINDVEVEGYNGNKRTLPEGTLVYFGEIYKAELGNTGLIKLIKSREVSLRGVYPNLRISGRFCDPQGKGGRIDMAQAGLPSQWYITREVKEQIKVINELIHEDRIAFDVVGCPMLIDEIELWHYPRKKSGVHDDPEIPVDDFDHAMSALRYSAANIYKLKRNKDFKKRNHNYITSTGGHVTARKDANGWTSAPSTHGTNLPASEMWRAAGGF